MGVHMGGCFVICPLGPGEEEPAAPHSLLHDSGHSAGELGLLIFHKRGSSCILFHGHVFFTFLEFKDLSSALFNLEFYHFQMLLYTYYTVYAGEFLRRLQMYIFVSLDEPKRVLKSADSLGIIAHLSLKFGKE